MTHTNINKRVVGERVANLKILFSSLKLDPAAELVYLFGSRASNTAGPLSDYDIGVYFSDMPDHNLKYYLGHQVTTVLDTDRIELVVLNQAPIELRYAVIATGTVIYEITKATRVDFESLTLSLYGDFLTVLRAQREEILKGSNYEAGIQRYRKALGKLDVCLKKLKPFRSMQKDEILKDPYFQDIIERNLQVAAQSVIDIANRIISLDALKKPRDYYEAILILGQAGILPSDFAQKLAPIAGFRNILVHDYLEIDWEEVNSNLQHIGDLETYMQHVKSWMREKGSGL